MTRRQPLLSAAGALLALTGLAPVSAGRPQGQDDTKKVQAPPSECIKCHATLDGLLAKAVIDWRGSIHAEQGIGCEGCHKGDPKAARFDHDPGTGFIGSPRLREIPYFCGKCHAAIKEKHLGSPHGEQGLPNCVTCHGGHAISAADPARIISEAACSKCHPYEPAAKALASLRKADGLLDELTALVARIEYVPAVQEHLTRLQEEMGLDKTGVASALHSFRIAEMDRVSANADRLKKMAKKLEERETQRADNIARERPMILLLTTFFLLAAYFGFLVYHGKGEVEPGK